MAIEPARLGAGLVVKAVLAAVGLVAFVLLAQAFVRGGQVVAIDDNVSRWMSGSLPGGAEWVARVATWFGGFVGAVVVTVAAVLALGRARRGADAVLLAAAMIGIAVLVPILKAIYDRARPDGGSPIELPHSYSFPSGHAATAVVLYGALGLLAAERARTPLRSAAWLAGATLVALAIGASRILLNVHFVSDVAAGFAVGLAWLCCCAIVRDVLTTRAGSPGTK